MIRNSWIDCLSVERRGVLPLVPLLLALALFSSSALPLGAAETHDIGQWWGTFEMGIGQLDRTAPGFSNNSGRFYLGLEGGIAVDSHVLLGLELSGWLIQAENQYNPTKGAGISQIFAVARIYPQPRSPLHFQLGAGAINGWDNSPSGSNRNGTGWEVGLGYDAKFSAHGAFTPFLRYNSGKAGKLKLSALTIGVGITWR